VLCVHLKIIVAKSGICSSGWSGCKRLLYIMSLLHRKWMNAAITTHYV